MDIPNLETAIEATTRQMRYIDAHAAPMPTEKIREIVTQTLRDPQYAHIGRDKTVRQIDKLIEDSGPQMTGVLMSDLARTLGKAAWDAGASNATRKGEALYAAQAAVRDVLESRLPDHMQAMAAPLRQQAQTQITLSKPGVMGPRGTVNAKTLFNRLRRNNPAAGTPLADLREAAMVVSSLQSRIPATGAYPGAPMSDVIQKMGGAVAPGFGSWGLMANFGAGLVPSSVARGAYEAAAPAIARMSRR